YPFASTHFHDDQSTGVPALDESYADAGDKGYVGVPDQLKKNKPTPSMLRFLGAGAWARAQQISTLAARDGANRADRWERVAFNHHLRLPDGLERVVSLRDVADYLDRSSFALFEAKG